ncbi:hypothetical protein SELMODRAFT_405073 [Selaginella moellendorffii]|uniref:Histone deacetylase interacting domain-containing protein n=1 Tax=Selaginella moellendorffii TaxID=88036 RepID=D8QYB2_SELML|nr:hypothetical protein SELMODRAFT_405073 [Selaginella moellendorffii]
MIMNKEASHYIHSSRNLLPKATFDNLMTLFRNLRHCRTESLMGIRLLLAPHPHCWEEFLQFWPGGEKAIEPLEMEWFGPSYKVLEQRESPKGDGGVLNTTLGLAKRPIESRTTIKTVHEKALFDCEDEQFETDMAIGHLGWAIDLIARLTETRTKIGRKRDLDLLVARLSMALQWSKAQVIELLRKEEAAEVCSRLRDAKDAMLKNREKVRTEWAAAYREHTGHPAAPYGDVPVIAADSALVAEIREAHDRNSATHSHYSLLSALLPADIALDIRTDDNVNVDVNALVNGCLSSPCRAWSYFLGNILGLGAPVPPVDAGTPLYRTDDSPRAAGGAARIFYGPEELYVLLRLYAKLHDRVSSARATCTDLGKLPLYANFLASAPGRDPFQERGSGEEWRSALGHGVYTIHELLARISKNIRELHPDSKAVQAIQLHEIEAARWRGGEIDDGGYFANAKFALLPYEGIYQFEVVDTAPGRVTINVRFFPDEFSRVSDLNTIRELIGYYAQQEWVEGLLADVEEEQRRGCPVFLRRNLRKALAMEDYRIHILNECLHRVTERGHRIVCHTEDLLVRFKGKLAQKFKIFPGKEKRPATVEDALARLRGKLADQFNGTDKRKAMNGTVEGDHRDKRVKRC